MQTINSYLDDEDICGVFYFIYSSQKLYKVSTFILNLTMPSAWSSKLNIAYQGSEVIQTCIFLL